jgi:hypothetical protein
MGAERCGRNGGVNVCIETAVPNQINDDGTHRSQIEKPEETPVLVHEPPLVFIFRGIAAFRFTNPWSDQPV